MNFLARGRRRGYHRAAPEDDASHTLRVRWSRRSLPTCMSAARRGTRAPIPQANAGPHHQTNPANAAVDFPSGDARRNRISQPTILQQLRSRRPPVEMSATSGSIDHPRIIHKNKEITRHPRHQAPAKPVDCPAPRPATLFLERCKSLRCAPSTPRSRSVRGRFLLELPNWTSSK